MKITKIYQLLNKYISDLLTKAITIKIKIKVSDVLAKCYLLKEVFIVVICIATNMNANIVFTYLSSHSFKTHKEHLLEIIFLENLQQQRRQFELY